MNKETLKQEIEVLTKQLHDKQLEFRKVTSIARIGDCFAYRDITTGDTKSTVYVELVQYDKDRALFGGNSIVESENGMLQINLNLVFQEPPEENKITKGEFDEVKIRAHEKMKACLGIQSLI